MRIGLVWILIFGELFLVVVGALAAMLFVNAARRRRDRQAAMYLVSVVKKTEPDRLALTEALLSEKYGYAGEPLKEAAHRIVKQEKLFFQRVINMYVKRDVICLRELNIDVEALTEPYRRLEVAGAPAAPVPASAEPAAGSGEDVSRLEAENAALKQELQITMETMSRMLGEYAAMFGGAAGGAPAAATMHKMMEEQDEHEAFEPDVDAGLDDEIEVGDSEAFEGDEGLEGLEELDDPGTFATPDDDLAQAFDDLDLPAEDEAGDETVVVAEEDFALDDGGVDLAADELNDIFGPSPGEQAASKPKPQTDAEGEPMDDDLADIWADALAEQEKSDK